MLRCVVVAAALALTACASKPELPPLPPRADLCTYYQSFRYSAPAAAVEELSALRAHAANETAHHEKCLLGDRSNSGGPR